MNLKNNNNMSRLKAEEARKIANDNSGIIQRYMDEIMMLIERRARQGSFILNYKSDIPDVTLITPIVEILTVMGYDVTTFSVCLLYTSPSPRDRG